MKNAIVILLSLISFTSFSQSYTITSTQYKDYPNTEWSETHTQDAYRLIEMDVSANKLYLLGYRFQLENFKHHENTVEFLATSKNSSPLFISFDTAQLIMIVKLVDMENPVQVKTITRFTVVRNVSEASPDWKKTPILNEEGKKQESINWKPKFHVNILSLFLPFSIMKKSVF